eukprot:6688074-Pyramimonas_sp.AAC.1
MPRRASPRKSGRRWMPRRASPRKSGRRWTCPKPRPPSPAAGRGRTSAPCRRALRGARARKPSRVRNPPSLRRYQSTSDRSPSVPPASNLSIYREWEPIADRER